MYREKKDKTKWKEWFYIVATSILLPCILTLLISGRDEGGGRKQSGIVIEMENGEKVDREEFLIYMIAGQVELDSHKEALKAQCVIARTNLMRELNGAKEAKASDLNIIYLTPEKLENNFGKVKKEEVIKKLNQVISATNSCILTYEEQPIEALYHYVSTGTTVSAEEVFEKARPYLIAVDSNQDVESEEYMTLSAWTAKEVLAKLQGMGVGKEYNVDTIFSALQVAEKTKNGYVKKVAIGEESVTGDAWRSMFGLNSSHFYLEEQEGQLRMIVLGKGHGVGLSQYGANRLAEEGWEWKEILQKYYPGAALRK